MKIVRFVIVIIELVICYLLQNIIKVHLPYASVSPDMLLVIVVGCAFMFGSNAGMVYGFIAGLLLDLTTGSPLGFAAAFYMFLGFLAGIFRKFYRKDDNVMPLVLTAAGEFLYLSFFYVINFMTRGRQSYTFLLKNMILPRITLTVLIAVFLYKLCQVSIVWSKRGDD